MKKIKIFISDKVYVQDERLDVWYPENIIREIEYKEEENE